MKKKIPSFRSDEEAEEFVASAKLTDYDLSGGVPVRFEFEPKAARVNMRLPEPLGIVPASEAFPISGSSAKPSSQAVSTRK